MDDNPPLRLPAPIQSLPADMDQAPQSKLPSRNQGCIFIVVMGVSGTGKSTLGSALAKELDMPYVEGDDLHPKYNVDKMASGVPLTDEDREPWLELIRTTAEHMVAEKQVESEHAGADNGSQNDRSNKGVVISCSALKRYYREILRGHRRPASKEAGTLPEHLGASHSDVLPTCFVFIDGPKEVLMERMTKRPGHFMKATMLDSQLATLETPAEEDGVVVVSVLDSTEEQVRKAKEGLTEWTGIQLANGDAKLKD